MASSLVKASTWGHRVRLFPVFPAISHTLPIDARIKEIQQQFLFPESRPEPAEIVQEEPVAEESSPSVTGVPHTIAVSGGIHFIMTDELAEAETEAAVEALGEGVDWVDVKGPTETEQHAQLEITETIVEAEVNGHAVVEESVTVATTTEASHQFPVQRVMH